MFDSSNPTICVGRQKLDWSCLWKLCRTTFSDVVGLNSH
jgi:hypothetical protein